MSEQQEIERLQQQKDHWIRSGLLYVKEAQAMVARLEAEVACLTRALADAERVAGEMSTMLERCADYFGISSWTFEQKWGKNWIDADGDVIAAEIRQALAAQPRAEAGAVEDTGDLRA